MTPINSHRPGYKHTSIGWIPDNWNIKRLGDCSTIKGEYGINAAAVDYSDNLPTYLRITDIDDDGNYSTTKKVSVNNENSDNYILKDGDIVFVRTGATVGKTYLHCDSNGKLVYAGFLIRFRLQTEVILPYYLKLFSKTKLYWDWVKVSSARSGQPGINAAEYCDINLPLPPLPEQKKIAEVLGTWDHAIEAQTKLITEKKKRKKALMQQLLTGKKRIKGYTGNWTIKEFKSFMTESRIVGNKGDIARKITIKLYGKGLLPKEEKSKGSNQTQYYKRRFGQFIYSKLDFLNGAFGIVPERLDGYESTLDLPAFDFTDEINSQWFLYFVSREEFYSKHLGLANGGRKARRVNPSDFLAIRERIPSFEEQQAIASVLQTADKEIALLEKRLEALREQKKGLMQKLLTGEVRVKL